MLSRPVCVEDAQVSRLDAPQLPDRADVILRCQLGDRIRRARVGGCLFIERLLALVPVDCSGGSQDHAPHADVAHGFHQADRSVNVDSVVFARVEHRLGDRNPGCQVVNHIHVLQQRPQLRTIVDIPAREVDIRRERLRVAGGQVVEASYLMSFTSQMVG